MKQFVNDAFAQDPRILQRRAEEKAQRCTPKLACCIADRLYRFCPCPRDRSVMFVQSQCKSVRLNSETLHTVHLYMSCWQSRCQICTHISGCYSGLIVQSTNMLCQGSALPDFKQYFWPFREKRKMDKAAARNKKAEDEKREKEEAAAAAAAAEAAAAEAATKERKARQVEKKAMQKQRSKLRTLSSSLVSSKSHLTVPTSVQAL